MARTEIQNELYPDCPIRNILARISDKWSILILFTLNQADQGMLTLGDLARELDISKQQLTKLVNDLEKRGLAARMRGEENHRKYYLQITEDGRQTLSGMVGSLMEPAERTFSSYTGDEKQELLRSILCLEQFLEDIRTGLANT